MMTTETNEPENAESTATPDQDATPAPDAPGSESIETAPPAPEPAPQVNPEVAALKAQMEEQRALIAQLLQQRQQPEPQKQDEELDLDKFISERFSDDAADALRKITKALDRKYASRADVEPIRQQTHAMTVEQQESAAQRLLREKGASDDDVKEVQRRIWDTFNKTKKAEWTSPEQAYRTVYADIILERGHARADKASAAKQAVVARQQANVTPSSTAPAGNGKVKLDMKEIRKAKGRPMTVEEILAEAERAGA